MHPARVQITDHEDVKEVSDEVEPLGPGENEYENEEFV